jgi:hypothetical protein
VEVKALDQESLANNVKTGTAAYSGFQNAQEAMSAIGAGTAAAPIGVSNHDMRTAFSDSVYAGASYNNVMDAVAKQGGFPERKDIDTGSMATSGWTRRRQGRPSTTRSRAGSRADRWAR